MAEDVLEVVDQDLSPVCLQLIGQGTDEGGASRARFGRQVGQEHLEGPLCIYKNVYMLRNTQYSSIRCTFVELCYDIQ